MTQKEEPKKVTPIIIKRINAGHAGGHGGAWKVAYADFMTAMMAFFLLLWLLNAVPTKKLQGLAEYFQPSLGFSGQKGMGFNGGVSALPHKQGLREDDRTKGFVYGVKSVGNLVSVRKPGVHVKQDSQDNEILINVQKEMHKAVSKDATLQAYKNNIHFQMTPEGLVINISGKDGRPMFKPGSSELTDMTKTILFKVAQLVKFSPNFIEISGYTDKEMENTDSDYSDWELSCDRANAARRYLIRSGVSTNQVAMVVGRADTDPVNPQDPYSAVNRRISITLLRHSIMPYDKLVAPSNLIGGASQEEIN